MLVVSSKNNLGCEAGCGLRFCGRIILGSWSDYSRIVPALEMTFHLFLDIFFEILPCHFSWQAQYLVRFDAPRIVNEVSYVMRTQNMSRFA